MNSRSLIAAAVLAALSTSAFAQTRVDRSGATDANNRVGSGGRNIAGGRDNPWDIANRVVYGNVTGGKGFRGPVGSTDPQAFRGPSAGNNSADFIRDSAAVSTGGQTSYNANQTRTFYGDNRAVAPPAGFTAIGAQGGYTPPVPTAWRSYDPRAQAVSTDNTTILNTPANNSTIVSGGEVNTQYAPNSFGGATDAGINSVTGLSEYTNLNNIGANSANLTPAQIKQMQSDSPTSQLPGQTPQQGQAGNIPTDGQPQQVQTAGTPLNAPNTPGNAPGGSPFGRPGNTNQSGAVEGAGSTPIDNSVSPQTGAVGLSAGVETGTVTRMVKRAGQPETPDAAGTADANAARDNGPERPGQAAEQANRQFNAEMRKAKQANTAQKDADQPAPKGGTDAAKPDGGPQAAAPLPGGKIGTFAGTATGQGVTDLLTKAEGQMKDGKYASAIDTYGAAEAISPRSATIKLGRANAELGGAYYRRAEGSVRQAFTTDPRLLKSQYDLRGFLGDDRLAAVQKDLSDLVQAKQNETGSAVLLAYVYYNTGNERRATALLDLADKRAGGRDPLIRSMKAAWKSAGEDTK